MSIFHFGQTRNFVNNLLEIVKRIAPPSGAECENEIDDALKFTAQSVLIKMYTKNFEKRIYLRVSSRTVSLSPCRIFITVEIPLFHDSRINECSHERVRKFISALEKELKFTLVSQESLLSSRKKKKSTSVTVKPPVPVCDSDSDSESVTDSDSESDSDSDSEKSSVSGKTEKYSQVKKPLTSKGKVSFSDPLPTRLKRPSNSDDDDDEDEDEGKSTVPSPRKQPDTKKINEWGSSSSSDPNSTFLSDQY
jgi:hypothetical protein